jgi:hypothetical protein
VIESPSSTDRQVSERLNYLKAGKSYAKKIGNQFLNIVFNFEIAYSKEQQTFVNFEFKQTF